MDAATELMIPHSKPTITSHDEVALSSQLLSGCVAKGAKVQEFESLFGQICGFKNTLFVESGSYAIKLALLLMNIKRGDEVIIPTYLCHSVLDAILAVGALPVLCDISNDWCVTLEDVERVITKRTKCLIIVHTMGISVDVKQFQKFKIPIIEDCCQALGTSDTESKQVGHVGDVSVFSFHAVKYATTGEGGMLCLNNHEYINRLNLFTGIKANGPVVNDLQAALGISQINQLTDFYHSRKAIAEFYFSSISNSNLYSPFMRVIKGGNFYRFLLRTTKSFELVKAYFQIEGIAIRRGVDELLHQTYPEFSKSAFPGATAIYNSTVSLPIYPSLPQAAQKKIVEALNHYEQFR